MKKGLIFLISILMVAAVSAFYFLAPSPPNVENPETFYFSYYDTAEERYAALNEIFPAGTPEKEIDEYAKRAGWYIGPSKNLTRKVEKTTTNRETGEIEEFSTVKECEEYTKGYSEEDAEAIKTEEQDPKKMFLVFYDENQTLKKLYTFKIYYREKILGIGFFKSWAQWAPNEVRHIKLCDYI